MIIQDDGGKIGNEIIVAVVAGAFVFAVLAYVIVGMIAGNTYGFISAVVVFLLIFIFVATKIGKYE
ncbi:hypothetical protein [Methanobacterium paludis]|uniref:Uncharacterized protein n=1 Tax=Methanobacterium paludis (strain DSM 25820 / JCM 18151 / SWAN1) TaxID=868131 RepID=F6D552_METPW|nr:hypothetical protein [Methanobacterium paludis]AEG17587.1 hypothetical protein MSWAN_0549 [Methanobacterium paludis]